MNTDLGRHDSAPLPPYEVLCVDLDEQGADGHSHVSGLTTRDPDGGETSWTAAQVIAALDSGEWFVVAAAGDREAATLTHASCPSCSEPSLQTDPEDALVKLGRC